MLKEEILTKIRKLRFPYGSYIVFGSGPLAAAGIRPSRDIDLFVSQRLYAELKKIGWQEHQGIEGKIVTNGYIEASNNWNFGKYHPSLKTLLKNAVVHDGIPFAGLADVREWKQEMGRPKDISDIELIDNHIAGDSKDLAYN